MARPGKNRRRPVSFEALARAEAPPRSRKSFKDTVIASWKRIRTLLKRDKRKKGVIEPDLMIPDPQIKSPKRRWR